jgi:hypothetical protein
MTRRRWLLVAAVPVLLWLLASSFVVVRTRSHLRAGRDSVDAVRALKLSEILDGSAAAKLRDAAADFGSGNDLAGSPLLVPFGPVPVLGRQVQTVADMSSAAKQILAASADFVTAVGDHKEAHTPQDRVAALDALVPRALELQKVLQSVDLGDGDGLLWFVSNAHRTLVRQVAELRDSLTQAVAALRGLQKLLTGPTDLLLLAANNAEMRAGQGAMLSWGTLHAEAGSLTVPGGMQPIRTFPLPPSAPPLDPELKAGWGWLDLSNVANLGVTPRFDVTARRILDLQGAATGHRQGGVLVIDSYALARLAKLTGKGITDVDGNTVAPEDVLSYLLHTQYKSIPADGLFAENTERRENLSTIAEQLTTRLLESVPLPDLVSTLDELGRTRHILAYSDDAVLEGGWDGVGIDGRLVPGDVAVGLVNAGASKLDQFIDTAVTVDTAEAEGGVEVMVTVKATNQTPAGEPPYVVGTAPPDGPVGGYSSLLTFSVPAAATNAAIDEASTYAVYTRDGPTTAMAIRVDLAAGQSRTVTARFTVPRGTVLSLLPTARVPRTVWTVAGVVRGDDKGTIELKL